MPLLVYIWGARRLTDPTPASGAPELPLCRSHPLQMFILSSALPGWMADFWLVKWNSEALKA